MEENERREGVLKQHFALYVKKPSMKDCFVTVFIFMICTIIGLLFQKLHFTDTNIVTIYILGVLITSILTDGYLCSIAGSFLSVVLFCFFLTEPRMSFQTYAVGYPVTFAIMLVCSVLAGTLSAKLKCMQGFTLSSHFERRYYSTQTACCKKRGAVKRCYVSPARSWFVY